MYIDLYNYMYVLFESEFQSKGICSLEIISHYKVVNPFQSQTQGAGPYWKQRQSILSIFLDKIPVKQHNFLFISQTWKTCQISQVSGKIKPKCNTCIQREATTLYILRGSFSWRQTPNFNDSRGTDLFPFLSTPIKVGNK